MFKLRWFNYNSPHGMQRRSNFDLRKRLNVSRSQSVGLCLQQTDFSWIGAKKLVSE